MDHSAKQDNGRQVHINRLIEGAIEADRRADSNSHNPHLAGMVAANRALAAKLRAKAAGLSV